MERPVTKEIAMELRRFFADSSALKDGVFTLCGEEFYHAVKVLRLKKSFKLVIAIGDGYDYLCEIIAIEKDYLKAKVIEITKNIGAPKVDVTLYQAAIKGGKTDMAVQKATELGASRIVIFFSENTSEREINIDRLKKVALEAAKQCGRSSLPEVRLLNSFEEVVNDASGCQLAVMAYEYERENWFGSLDFSAESAAVIVGSEGGFTPKEADLARKNGIITLSLGKRILRAETATVSALTLMMYGLGEMKA